MTLVLTGLVVVCGLGLIPGGDAAAFASVWLFIFGFIWLFFALQDLFAPVIRKRETSEAAVKCFVHRVQAGRWSDAYICLSPLARNSQPVVIPEVHALSVVGGQTTFGSPKGFKTYWSSFVQGGKGMVRRISKTSIQPIQTDPSSPVHRHMVRLEIEYYSQWLALFIFVGLLPAVIIIMLARKTHVLEFPVVTVRHHSQWWILTGQGASPLDRTLQL